MPNAPSSQQATRPDWVLCHHCDAAYARPTLARNEVAKCKRCNGILLKPPRLHPQALLALSITALLAFLFANFYPIVNVELNGDNRSTTIVGAAMALSGTSYGLVTALVLATLLLFPLLEILMMLWVSSFLVAGKRCPGFHSVVHTLQDLAPWGMLDVFALSLAVALAKLFGIASVTLNIGMVGLVGLVILMPLLSKTPLHELWDQRLLNRLAESPREVSG